MVANSGQAVQADDNAKADEPSMDEILASIRQIIADDEAQEEAGSARENFTFPEGHSNTNEATEGEIADAQMQAAMEAELASLSGESGADGETAGSERSETIEERAERLRAEIAAPTAGLSAEERIAHYRIRGRLQMEEMAERKAKEAEAAAEDEARRAAEPAPAPTPAAPPVFFQTAAPAPAPMFRDDKALVTEMAERVMSERGQQIDAMLGETMRPIVRQWLEDNLPGIVERLVREEIERVGRRR